MAISPSTPHTLRAAAAALAFAGILLGVGTATASADPTLVPTPEPQGPIARTPKSADQPVQPVPGPDAQPCFACQPNQVSDNPAGPGPAPTVSPPQLSGSNSGVPATATNLIIWGDHFHPGDAVYIEVRGSDGKRYWDGTATADGAGNVNVKTSRGTDSSTPVNGYAVAIDQTAGLDSNRLPVAIKGGPAGPSQVDNG